MRRSTPRERQTQVVRRADPGRRGLPIRRPIRPETCASAARGVGAASRSQCSRSRDRYRRSATAAGCGRSPSATPGGAGPPTGPVEVRQPVIDRALVEHLQTQTVEVGLHRLQAEIEIGRPDGRRSTLLPVHPYPVGRSVRSGRGSTRRLCHVDSAQSEIAQPGLSLGFSGTQTVAFVRPRVPHDGDTRGPQKIRREATGRQNCGVGAPPVGLRRFREPAFHRFLGRTGRGRPRDRRPGPAGPFAGGRSPFCSRRAFCAPIQVVNAGKINAPESGAAKRGLICNFVHLSTPPQAPATLVFCVGSGIWSCARPEGWSKMMTTSL